MQLVLRQRCVDWRSGWRDLNRGAHLWRLRHEQRWEVERWIDPRSVTGSLLRSSTNSAPRLSQRHIRGAAELAAVHS
jgi:hypothetical protein